jgi:hypothetical protein
VYGDWRGRFFNNDTLAAAPLDAGALRDMLR